MIYLIISLRKVGCASMSKQQLIIVGTKGMLGQMVEIYFSAKSDFEVVSYNEQFTQNNYDSWTDFLKSYPEAVIINCAGKIKQKSDNLTELLWSNAVLPLAIISSLGSKQKLIHPSTDCVFTGLKGSPYQVIDSADATDAYGWSKRLAESALVNHKQCAVIRVSIIGPDFSGAGKGLLAWFLSLTPQSSVSGFTNHLWNGITTLAWCELVEKIITNQISAYGTLLQVGTDSSYSKYEILQLFNQTFNRSLAIAATEHPEGLDRRLVPSYLCPDLATQLKELASFITDHL